MDEGTEKNKRNSALKGSNPSKSMGQPVMSRDLDIFGKLAQEKKFKVEK